MTLCDFFTNTCTFYLCVLASKEIIFSIVYQAAMKVDSL